MNDDLPIRSISAPAIGESGALNLVWRVFLEFEAPEYSDRGIQEFKNFLDLETVKQRMINHELFCWGCFDMEKIVGMIAAKPPCHIALLFVDKAYHRRGIARALYNTVIDFYKKTTDFHEITVNSSPYAAEVYHKFGFADTNTEQTINGIRFIPMKNKF
jgi:GNAT superfamily N-acetyltransferase